LVTDYAIRLALLTLLKPAPPMRKGGGVKIVFGIFFDTRTEACLPLVRPFPSATLPHDGKLGRRAALASAPRAAPP
jgi:hypothetical protein